MDDIIFEQILDQLPKNAPFKICRLCIQETYGLLQIADIADFSNMYKNITNVELPNGQEHPNHVCPSCMRLLRQSNEFKDILRTASVFWQTYLEKPSFSAQFPFIEIKTEPDESSHPIGIFLPCYSHTDNKDDIDTTVTDDYQTVKILDFGTRNGGKNKTRLKKARKVMEKSGFCEICFKDFRNYDRHIAVARHNLHFNCAHCGMGFKIKEFLLKHLQSAHINYDPIYDGKPFCTICQQEYISHEHWRRHIENAHYTITKFTCPVCNKIFSSPTRYNQHKRLHWERTLQCPQCPKKFAELCYFKTHLAVHKADKPFMCEICAFSTKHKSNMQRHILGVHGNKKQRRKTYENPNAHCYLCNENFNRFKPFKDHLQEKHATLADSMLKKYRSDRKAICKYCVKRFDSIEKLEEHNRSNMEKHRLRLDKIKKNRRPIKKDTSGFGIRYTCDICKNSFNSQRVLDSHIANHSKEPRPFICDICQATYRRMNDLTLHTQRVHTGERPFRCDICDFRCLTRPELNSHNRHRHKIIKNSTM